MMSVSHREHVEVSHEMIALIGTGLVSDRPWPADPVAVAYSFGGVGNPAGMRWIARPDRSLTQAGDAQLVLIVATDAMARLFGTLPHADGASFHISPELRAIGLAVRDCSLPEAAREPYRLAKSIELLCDTMRLLAEGALVPILGESHLSQEDSRRLLAVRRMIDERWAEKLTLETLARACGLNRAKLTRGFRNMFDCSIADALAEQRLEGAQRLLLATDLSVSSIGYRCGYLNNASFTRAFSRRFGVAPSHYRARRLAA